MTLQKLFITNAAVLNVTNTNKKNYCENMSKWICKYSETCV